MIADDDVTEPELASSALDADQRQRLREWASVEPPANLADRVMLRMQRTPTMRTRTFAIAAACALTAAAAAGWTLGHVRRAPTELATASSGAVTVTSRVSTTLGARGTAVAEPGASFSWEVAPNGNATVMQSAGDVFYRVEHGGPFVVDTPAGEVRVTGTSFRVEVKMKKQIISGVAGAAIATAVVISVYEGGVVIAGRSAAPQKVAAGESLTVAVPAGSNVAAVDSVAARADVGAMTRDQIVAHDQAQAARIAQLEAKLQAFEASAAAARNREFDRRPSKEKLLDWAKTCTVSLDFPALDGQTWVPVEAGGRYAKTDLPAVNEAFGELHSEWIATVRAAYIEVTGDEAGAKSMSASAMASELGDKGAADEIAALRARVAEERAGLRPPPAPGAKLTALERYVRAFYSLGDSAEAALVKRLGPERAAAIRGEHWDSYGTSTGCPEAK